MTLRLKTVEYVFPLDTTALATATRRDQAAITINIPHTDSRTFRSVRIQVGYRDTATSATSLTNPLIGVKLGAAAFSDATLGNPVANSGESLHYIFERDVTSYFNTNFGSGTSQTCQVGTQHTGPSVINICIKLLITYEYEDAPSGTPVATEIKTVRLPIESTTGALTATLANVGTNQIPALSHLLPESSKVYRQIWLEAIYNEYTAGTANDAALGVSVAGAAEQLTGNHESALASSCSGWAIFNQGATPSWSLTAAGNLQARSSNITTASTFNHVAFVLCATYEYRANDSATTLTEDLDASETGVDVTDATVFGTAPYTIEVDSEQMLVTSVASNTLTVTRGHNGTTAATHANGAAVSPKRINSLVIPLGTIDLPGATAATDAAQIEKELLITEPGTITLVQSGALVQYVQTAAVGPNIAFGGQTARAYTDSAQAFCGETFLTQRVDSGSAQGAGITIARGRNLWRWAVHIGTAGFTPGSFDGWMFLNYLSGKSINGDGAHNHSVNFSMQNSQASGTISTITAAQFINIPEAKWWRTALGFYSNSHGHTASPQYWLLGAEVLSGESARQDFREVGKGWFTHDGEAGWYPFTVDAGDEARGVFQRFDADPEADRIVLEGSRRWKIAVGQAGTRPLACWLTYHSMQFRVQADIEQSEGGTVNVALYRKSDGLKVGSTSRSGNGQYTIQGYDNTETYFAEARESGTRVGRSDDITLVPF